MKLTRRITRFLAVAFIAAIPAIASATTIATTDPFFETFDTIDTWLNSALGVAIALAAIVIGAFRSVGNGNPISVLTGIAVAAFISWASEIVLLIVTGGFTIPTTALILPGLS